ncbi:MAG: hypothetical protein U0903_07310 [Planctomycetales bacterium]
MLNADGTAGWRSVGCRVRGRSFLARSGYGRARTANDGRFQIFVPAELAYLLSVDQERWVARKVGVVVREGKPVKDVELQLSEGREIVGRVTRGTDRRPQKDISLSVRFTEPIPAELEALRKAGDKSYYYMQWHKDGKTDADGRYRIIVPPGEYMVMGPRQALPAKVKVQDAKVIQDFDLPGEEFYPLSGIVVDASGKPAPGLRLKDGISRSELVGCFIVPNRCRRAIFGEARTLADDAAVQITGREGTVDCAERSQRSTCEIPTSTDGDGAGTIAGS